ncbi:MAG: hypothetical protein KTR16_06315 [Acidiferrobacterales bacterium]|nr:hypothetical protein [Acidiferrobacterales bacterium]
MIEIHNLDQQIEELKSKRNSLYARIETLKLRGPNKNPKLIDEKKGSLLAAERQLKALEKIRADGK